MDCRKCRASIFIFVKSNLWLSTLVEQGQQKSLFLVMAYIQMPKFEACRESLVLLVLLDSSQTKQVGKEKDCVKDPPTLDHTHHCQFPRAFAVRAATAACSGRGWLSSSPSSQGSIGTIPVGSRTTATISCRKLRVWFPLVRKHVALVRAKEKFPQCSKHQNRTVLGNPMCKWPLHWWTFFQVQQSDPDLRG